jgi:hypothetical protein
MEREDAEFRAANERITKMAEDLRKAQQVRDRLEELDRLMGSYPEGHEMRTRLVELHIERALEGVEKDILALTVVDGVEASTPSTTTCGSLS